MKLSNTTPIATTTLFALLLTPTVSVERMA